MKKVLGVLLLASLPVIAYAGWQDFLKQQVDSVSGGAQNSSTDGALTTMDSSMLGQQEITAGLKQALEKGVDYAIDGLGQADGFLGNPKVKIPMPEKLSQLEGLLRKLGQDQYADEFVVTMNRAAEQAVPLTKDILKKGVRELTIEDAKKLLNGPDDAATQYLQKVGGDSLRQKIAPMVKQSTDKVGVTRQYKNLFNNLGFMGNMLNPDDYDIDKYITDETMDGIFTMLAEQEKQIRENPMERTTDLLKKVFAN